MALIGSYLLSIYSLVTFEKLGLTEKIMTKLIKSINNYITNLLRCDLARVRKSCWVLQHAIASVKAGNAKHEKPGEQRSTKEQQHTDQ